MTTAITEKAGTRTGNWAAAELDGATAADVSGFLQNTPHPAEAKIVGTIAADGTVNGLIWYRT